MTHLKFFQLTKINLAFLSKYSKHIIVLNKNIVSDENIVIDEKKQQ